MGKKRPPATPRVAAPIRFTESQRHACELWKECDVLFIVGPAGTGKTHLAVSLAVTAIRNAEALRIVASRPTVQAGEDLGFLPGDLNEKIDPYMAPIYDVLQSLLREGEKIEVEAAPLAYMRGRTFHDAIAILDEAQNCTREQIKLFLTRIGSNAKLIITGDPEQSDLPGGRESLMQTIDYLDGVARIGIVEISAKEIVRHPLISRILARLS